MSLTGNDVSTARDIIGQETEVENFEGIVSTSLSYLELKPITEDINDTAVTRGDITSCSMGTASGNADFELETLFSQSFKSTDVLTVVADSSIIQRPLEVMKESFSVLENMKPNVKVVPRWKMLQIIPMR